MIHKMPGGALAGFLLMQIGIVLVLVAQSFHTVSRLVILWSGGTVLLLGIVLCVLDYVLNTYVTARNKHEDD